MHQIYSSVQLLSFIYGECKPAQHAGIINALAHNPSLKAEFDSLLKGHKTLTEPACSATTASIDKIMQYSRLTA
jgi:hypothetical protein